MVQEMFVRPKKPLIELQWRSSINPRLAYLVSFRIGKIVYGGVRFAVAPCKQSVRRCFTWWYHKPCSYCTSTMQSFISYNWFFFKCAWKTDPYYAQRLTQMWNTAGRILVKHVRIYVLIAPLIISFLGRKTNTLKWYMYILWNTAVNYLLQCTHRRKMALSVLKGGSLWNGSARDPSGFQ